MARKLNPQDDPNSIGSLLLAGGLTEAELDRAIAFKRDHCDIMLGEACVRLGFVTRDVLEVAVAKQNAATNGGVIKLAKLAKQRTVALGQRIERNTLTGQMLLARLAE